MGRGIRFIHITDPDLSAEKQRRKGEGEERRFKFKTCIKAEFNR